MISFEMIEGTMSKRELASRVLRQIELGSNTIVRKVHVSGKLCGL